MNAEIAEVGSVRECTREQHDALFEALKREFGPLALTHASQSGHAVRTVIVVEDYPSGVDSEVLAFLHQLLKRGYRPELGLVSVMTTAGNLVVLLDQLGQLTQCIPEQDGVGLVALSHYSSDFELFGGYHFVAGTADDAVYFAQVLSRFQFVRKFWALGCKTAHPLPYRAWNVGSTCFAGPHGSALHEWRDAIGRADHTTSLLSDDGIRSFVGS